MNIQYIHPADQLVMIMARIYQYGMTTTSGGNLSIRDENGDVWITPSSIDKGALTRQDICCVKPDGTVIGPHKPSVELPFHLDIYKIRPDLKAILHAHPPTLVAFSVARVLPAENLVPDLRQVCGEIVMADYDVPGSQQLGKNIAKRFAEGYNTVMMENHGCVIGAKDLFSAFMAFETLDFCGRLQIDAQKLGTLHPLTAEQIEQSAARRHPLMDEFIPKCYSSEERAARRDMCRLIHRAYDQRLFTSTQGTFSVRLTDGSFLITPYNKDRKYLEPEDIVHIKGGMCEQGKRPSRSVLLHQKIYEKHPEVGSVILAHAPAIMAFAVTDAEFDSRLIPESYLMLQDVKRVPFMAATTDPDGTAAAFDKRTPVLLVDNECVLVAGQTLLNAFDRLEVLEYSAKALIAARDIGPLVKITEPEVQAIREAFHMDD